VPLRPDVERLERELVEAQRRDETVEAIAQDIEVRRVRTSIRALLADTIEKLWG